MSWIIIAVLGLAAVMLIFSLFKKLIKLAFTALALLLLVGGLWYFWQEADVEIPESVRQAGEEAAGKIGEVAGEALDKAAEVAKEGAGRAIDKAAEAAREGAEKAIEDAVEDGGNEATKPPPGDPADQEGANQ